MKLIICPTDFSANATNAIHYAAALGSGFNSRIILIHAYDTPVMYSEVPLSKVRTADAQIHAVAEKKLVTLMNRLSKQFKKVTFEYHIAVGLPQEQIVKLASKLTADLIVMGTTGTNKLERLLMGSTTARVIRDANCPVLCVPQETSFNGIHKIVFSTDLKEDNINAASTLSGFAKNFDATLIFLFVDDKHMLHSDEDTTKMTQKIRQRVKYPKMAGYISRNTNITKGVEFFLKKNPADLLVMFTHARHFPESLFNQSITRMMSHQTRIPILALKHADRAIMA